MDENITLINGDCRTHIDSMPDNSVHLAVTDPPYFLDGLDEGWRKGSAKQNADQVIGRLPVGMKFDTQQGLKLGSFIEGIATKMLRVLMPGSFAVMFSQPRLSHRMAVGIEDAGFEIRDMFAWQFTRNAQGKSFSMDHFIDKMDISELEKVCLKRSMENRHTPQLRPQFETIILAQKPKQGTHVENWIKYQTGLFDTSQSWGSNSPTTVMYLDKTEKDWYNTHLTVKPVRLIEHLVALFSVEGQVVLDPFLGSGTTAVACMNKKRNCIGIEINPEYFSIAKTRIEHQRRFIEWLKNG